MRIGVITTSYPRVAEDPAGGFVRGLNLYLLRQGHQIEVIAAGELPAPGRLAPRRSVPDADGIPVLRLPSGLFYQGGAPDALGQGGSAALRAAAEFQGRLLLACARRVQRYDALISHWLVPSGVAAALCAGGRPHVAIAHSSDVHLLRRLRLGGLGRWLSGRAANR